VEALGGVLATCIACCAPMEERARIRRGYLVEGPRRGRAVRLLRTVDGLRRVRMKTLKPRWCGALAAADPANPYGWLLLASVRGLGRSWRPHDCRQPARCRPRHSGRPNAPWVQPSVLVGGVPVLYLDRNARRLLIFADVGRGTARNALCLLSATSARCRPSAARSRLSDR
jgi:hypothetical protein